MSEEKQERIIGLLIWVNNNQISINQNIFCIGLINIILTIVILLIVLFRPV